MGYQPFCCGFQRLTASGIVSDSGKPILIYGYGVETGAAAAEPYLMNGTAQTSPVAFALGPCVAAQGNVQPLPAPVMFPGGCYVSFDTNTNAVTVFYVLQSVTS